MTNIIFFEKEQEYGEWKDLNNQGNNDFIAGTKSHLLSNGITIFILKTVKDDTIEKIIEKIPLVYPTIMACHQPLIEDHSDLETEFRKKWPYVEVYEYSIGCGYVAKCGKQGENHQPTVDDSGKKYTITTLREKKKYHLIPQLFDITEEQKKTADRENAVSELQLCIQAMIICLNAGDAVSRVGRDFAEALGQFFKETAKRTAPALGLAELEKEFVKFGQNDKQEKICNRQHIEETIAACQKIVKLLDMGGNSGDES